MSSPVSDVIVLPESAEVLSRVIDEHVQREVDRSSLRSVQALFYYYYLNGIRDFQTINSRTGIVKIQNFVGKQPPFRNQELISKINQWIGWASALDWRPAVIRDDSSLGTIRDRSRAQAILDQLISSSQLSEVKPLALWNMAVKQGSGFIARAYVDARGQLASDVQVIDPLELYPFPSVEHDRSKASGLVWRRMVSFEYLKQRFGSARVAGNKSKMSGKVYRVSPGTSRTGAANLGAISATDNQHRVFTGPPPTDKNGDDGLMMIAELTEVFIIGPNYTLQRQIAKVGNWIAEDQSYEDGSVYCPISYARFAEGGSFYGISLADILYPLNREMEVLLASLFKNLQTMDKYDMLVLPSSMIDLRKGLHDTGAGLKVLTYSADLNVPTAGPMTIRHATAGALPGQTATFAKQLMDSLALPEILSGGAPGRVDSASGLRFLEEKAVRSQGGAVSSLATALGHLYRSLVQQALRLIIEQQIEAIPFKNLNIDMVGLKMDAEKGQFNLTDLPGQPLQSLDRLTFTMKDMSARSPSIRLQQAYENVTNQLMDKLDFVIFTLEEGLDVAMNISRERNAHEKTVMDVVTLYGDGETPGEVMQVPAANYPELALRIVNAFMAGPMFIAAKQPVQDAFVEYKADLEIQAGTALPMNYETPDDAAILRDSELQAQQIVAGAIQGN